MSLTRLILQNIRGNGFRSVAIFLCLAIVGGFSLSATLILQGSDRSLRWAADRLGADIVVVPDKVEGEENDPQSPVVLAQRYARTLLENQVEGPLTVGRPSAAWLPEDKWPIIATVPGVAAASPQIYLPNPVSTSAADLPQLSLVAFDPQTDFTVQPWFERRLGRGLSKGEAVGGSQVTLPAGQSSLTVSGYDLRLKGNLEATGTAVDQTLFVSIETAREMAAAGAPFAVPPDGVSAVLVKVRPGADPDTVAIAIMREVTEVTAVQASKLYLAFRQQLAALRQGFFAMLVMVWAICELTVAFLFSVTINERRREIGVFRALGSSRRFVLVSLLAEGAVVALAGGAAGEFLSASGLYLAKDLIASALALPWLFPSWPELLSLAGASLVLSLAAGLLAVLFPALVASRRDPSLAMKE